MKKKKRKVGRKMLCSLIILGKGKEKEEKYSDFPHKTFQPNVEGKEEFIKIKNIYKITHILVNYISL